MKHRQRDWAMLGFASALGAMTLIAAISYRSISGFMTRSQSVAQTYEVLLGVEEWIGFLTDAESSQRGFLLTGDESHLQHYRSTLELARARIRELRALAGDDAAAQIHHDRLDILLAQRSESLESGIALARDGADMGAVVAWVRQGEGQRLMSQIRAVTGELTRHEEGLLALRAAESDASARMARGAVIVGGLASLAMLLVVFGYLRREIIRRQRIERSLRRSHDEIQDLYNNAPCGYHSLDADGVFVRINDTELAWLGYERDEVVGRIKFIDLLAPDSVPTFLESFPRFKATGEISDLDFTLLRKNGGDLEVSLSATAMRDADGNYLQSRSTMFDVSRRKQAEARIAQLHRDLERHAADLERANHELESFSYTVSHDLRSPLRAIDGFSRILEEDFAERLDAEGMRLLKVIRDNSRAMARLIDDLLQFSRLGRKPMAATTIDMHALVNEALQEVLRGESSRVAVVANALPEGWGDPALLKQVWINLLSNGVKFSGRRERPRVEVGGSTNGDENVYFVRDNGAGFDMRYYDKLFGVFQRLHRPEEFDGTGVGLAIVHRVITRLGGRVWAESAPDQGASFFFALPVQGAQT